MAAALRLPLLGAKESSVRPLHSSSNRFHEIKERLARWLLICRRIQSEYVPVTHEFLAQMLGTGRPGVSLVAGDSMRGTVRIRNRKELESAACECYRTIQRSNRALEDWRTLAAPVRPDGRTFPIICRAGNLFLGEIWLEWRGFPLAGVQNFWRLLKLCNFRTYDGRF